VVVALDAGQHLAQHVVREAFHRGEQEAGHGKILLFKTFRARNVPQFGAATKTLRRSGLAGR
jgi:hypothetical protein